ncbi:MAG: ZIP family metal transporter [Clostridiales bacterium]|nr:ZIP family metal transporter [Clostridiales bacterium]
MTFEILAGVIIPFLGTAMGAAAALLCKKNVSPLINKLLAGFAAGVMIAASIWSLIMPSVEMAELRGVPSFLPAAIGFMLGILALIAIDTFLPTPQCADGVRKNKMLVFAVTVHNVPEGMAVGAVFAGFLAGSEGITLAAALSLSIGIALQNIPEGAIVGLPLVSSGQSKGKAFFTGVMSGVVEPIAALITIALYVIIVAALPYLLAFAAGAMIYVVAKELVPEISEGNLGIIGLSVGFVLMMIMDLVL